MTNNWDESKVIRATTPGKGGEFKEFINSGAEIPELTFDVRVLTDEESEEAAWEIAVAELRAERERWGDVEVKDGARTPWGSADWITNVAQGIVSVSTPGHGGLKLSPERNRAIPTALRSSSGWYEEDCEANIVAMYHPDAFPNHPVEDSEQSVKNWFPDKWEKATGKTLTPGESTTRDEQNWTKAHENDLIVRGADRDPDDNNFLIVTASIGGRGEDRRRFRMPADEYQNKNAVREIGQGHRTVIDLDRYEELPPVPKQVRTPATRFHGIGEGKTDAARERILSDLNKRWRDADGTVRTLREMIAEEGFSDKGTWMENGKRKYSLHQKVNNEDSGYTSIPVSKATWDAIEAPDSRTPRQIAYEEATIAENNYEKVRAEVGPFPRYDRDQKRLNDARQRAEKTNVDLMAAQAVEDAERVLRQNTATA